jgi:hypothetical protein
VRAAAGAVDRVQEAVKGHDQDVLHVRLRRQQRRNGRGRLHLAARLEGEVRRGGAVGAAQRVHAPVG